MTPETTRAFELPPRAQNKTTLPFADTSMKESVRRNKQRLF
jgi:hypothetical protein